MAKKDAELVFEGTAHLRNALKITKVVVTRSVKGQRGDSYTGFSASFDTIQDDAGGRGSDLISAQDGDLQASIKHGLSLKDARLSALLLGMQVDIAAHAQAMGGGNITYDQYIEAVKAIKHNYTKLMADMLRGKAVNDDG